MIGAFVMYGELPILTISRTPLDVHLLRLVRNENVGGGGRGWGGQCHRVHSYTISPERANSCVCLYVATVLTFVFYYKYVKHGCQQLVKSSETTD